MGLQTHEAMRRLRDRWSDDTSYVRRPAEWVRDRAGEHLWSKQREICDSVRDNRYTAVPSAHDLGKSFIGSRIIGWWNDVHPTGSSFVVSTAPSAAQVSAILWREVAKLHRQAGLRGRINRAGYPQWYEGAELVGYGRKPADYEESAFQGIHALYVLVVIDEAGGIDQHLFNSVDALATNFNARVLAIGNPDDPGSHFARICKPGSGWNVIQLDALRSPNMAAHLVIGDNPAEPRYPLTAALLRAEGIEPSTEEVPGELRPYLVDALWIEERIQRWCGFTDTAYLDYDVEELGEMIRRRADASPLFQAKVRGIFPTSTATGVIPLGWVQQAVNRWRDWHAQTNCAIEAVTRFAGRVTDKIVGVDVAYGGQDETVIAVRYGDGVMPLSRYRHADTVETADMAAVHLHEPQCLAVVDVIGIGAGVYDTLRRYRRNNKILGRAVAFNAAAASHRTDKIGEFKFANDRAAAWWKFRESLDPSRGSKVMLPDDERLIEELTAVKYAHYADGVIKIESKDDIRKRLGRSTDSADAVVQAFWPDGLRIEELLGPEATRDRRSIEVSQGALKRGLRSRVIQEEYDDGLDSSGFTEEDFAVDEWSATLG